MIKFWLRTYELTYATMGQDPHEFIINTEWKNATPKNDRKQRPVGPIKTTSMCRELIQGEMAHVPIKIFQTMPYPPN
jgi:hypothetical protein